MSMRSVCRPVLPRSRRAGAIGVFVLLALCAAVPQGGVPGGGADPPEGLQPADRTSSPEWLRERVAREGWVWVQVDLRGPQGAGARRAPLTEDLQRTADDLLFALPAGTYRSLPRAAGSPGLTLRVDESGLDGLLASPAVSVAAAGTNPLLHRIAGGGSSHSLAVRSDGGLWAWGKNTFGQLGDGTNADRHSPVEVNEGGSPMTGVASVAAGSVHSLALKIDGTLWAWGWNNYGQLGDGTTTNRWSPVQVLSGVAAVAAGSQGNWSVAVKTDGTVWAWGSGYGSAPVEIQQGGSPLTGIAGAAAGMAHGLAIEDDGGLWSWGWNLYGQLGDGTDTNRASAVQPTAGGSPLAAIAAAGGSEHSLAVAADGGLWAWGRNLYGQLGDGTGADRRSPVQVLSLGSPMVGGAAVAAGAGHSLALQDDGTLWGWGSNWTGQVGDASTVNRSTPVQVLSGVAEVAAGPVFSLAFKTDGSLWAWGDNGSGQLGLGAVTGMQTAPVQVSGFAPLPDFAVTEVVLTPSNPTAGATFGAAVTVTNRGPGAGIPGTLQLWLDQAAGQPCGAVGDGSATGATPLAAGASATFTLNGLPAGTAGSRTMRLFVDSGCETPELDESDNQPTQGYSVVPAPTPDFAVTAVTLTPSGPVASGGTFSAAVTVSNLGTVSGTPGRLQIWLDQPLVRQCGAGGNRAAVVKDIPPGGQRTVTIGALAPGAVGAKTFRAFVDSRCETTETFETNNQMTKGYKVYPRPIPDFVVSAIVLTPQSPTAGGTFSAAVTVTNVGSGGGDGGWLDLWADLPAVQACMQSGDSYAGVGYLGARDSKTLTLSGLPAGTAGSKALRAFVDSWCGTKEVAEVSNNQATKTYLVVP